MKRINNIWNNVLNVYNAVDEVINATKSKRGYRSVQPLLYSDGNPAHYHMIDVEKAKEFVKPIIEELRNRTWVHEAPRYIKRFCRSNVPGGGKWRNLYVPTLKDHII